jgi:UDP-N-acetylmuramate dehydrogenase
MDLSNLARELKALIAGEVLVREPMANYTSWRIGGPADLLVLPVSTGDVRETVRFSRERNLPLTVLGNGSNVLVLDRGIRGIVLRTASALRQVGFETDRVVAEAGVLLPPLARMAASKGLSGLEFAAGIPGSLGGAICMNAGAHRQSISSVVESVTVMDHLGCESVLSPEAAGFSYRQSLIPERGQIVIQATLQLVAGAREEITARVRRNLARRREGQPLNLPSAGSVFKNPPGDWAGRLIEAAGAKGWRVGEAQVSEKHANFIVNLGEARAEEVLLLISKVRRQVAEKFGVQLELEILPLGEGP